MEEEEQTPKCPLLHSLPPELRLRIYDHLFAPPCHTSLLIRSSSRIEVIAFGKAHAALLKTCRALYAEAAPVLYNNTTFRIQIYPVEGYPTCGNFSHLSRNTLYLRRIRHLQIKACVIFPKQTLLAQELLTTLVGALEAAGADVRTLEVNSSFYSNGWMKQFGGRESSAAAGSMPTPASGVPGTKLIDRVVASMDDGEAVPPYPGGFRRSTTAITTTATR